MAALTESQAIDQIKAIVNLFAKYDDFGRSNTPNYLGLLDTVKALATGDYGGSVQAVLDSLRDRAASMLAPDVVSSALAPAMFDLGNAIGAPLGEGAERIARFWAEYMAEKATPDTLNSRDITYGTITAVGTPTGDPTWYRVTVDEFGYPLEACHTETKTLECIADQSILGEKHREVFELRGEPAEPSLLLVDGSGISGVEIQLVTSRETQRLLRNPTFSALGIAAPTTGSPVSPSAVTDITNWTLDAVTGVTIDADTTYRDLTGETRTHSVRFTQDRYIEQSLVSQNRAKFDTSVPYHLQVAVYRESLADGTITLTLGGVSQTFTVSSLTNNAWNVIALDRDKDLYHRNWTTDDPKVRIQWSGMTTGSIYIDDVILVPYQLVDGTYWLGVGGRTPALRQDKYQVTDSRSGAEATMQYWIGFRSGWRISFPSATGGLETIADPT